MNLWAYTHTGQLWTLWAYDHFSIICLFIHLKILRENFAPEFCVLVTVLLNYNCVSHNWIAVITPNQWTVRTAQSQVWSCVHLITILLLLWMEQTVHWFVQTAHCTLNCTHWTLHILPWIGHIGTQDRAGCTPGPEREGQGLDGCLASGRECLACVRECLACVQDLGHSYT